MEQALRVYEQQQRAFRLNTIFGVILRKRETGQYRYCVPYSNNGILDRPLYLSRWTDLHKLRLIIQRMDIKNELLRQRPDTKWIPGFVTNLHFFVYKTSYHVGTGGLPEYLLWKNSLYPLVVNRGHRRASRVFALEK